MGSIINRVKQVATYYNTSVVKWEETLGLSPSHFYNIKAISRRTARNMIKGRAIVCPTFYAYIAFKICKSCASPITPTTGIPQASATRRSVSQHFEQRHRFGTTMPSQPRSRRKSSFMCSVYGAESGIGLAIGLTAL